MEVNIEIKLAYRSNFTEFSMDSFDRSQEVRNVYSIENGKLVLKNNLFTETWSPERKRENASEILSGQYITYCAFADNTVVGEIMLMAELNEGRMIIDSSHLSRDYRRHGIGQQMIETVTDCAKSSRAEALYASCCSAEETIAFTRRWASDRVHIRYHLLLEMSLLKFRWNFQSEFMLNGNYGQKGSKV